MVRTVVSRKADGAAGDPRRNSGTKKQCLESLAAAIKLMLEIQEEELSRLTGNDAERMLVEVA